MSRWRARTRITSTYPTGQRIAYRVVRVQAHTEREARAAVVAEHRGSAPDELVSAEDMTILEIARTP